MNSNEVGLIYIKKVMPLPVTHMAALYENMNRDMKILPHIVQSKYSYLHDKVLKSTPYGFLMSNEATTGAW